MPDRDLETLPGTSYDTSLMFSDQEIIEIESVASMVGVTPGYLIEQFVLDGISTALSESILFSCDNPKSPSEVH